MSLISTKYRRFAVVSALLATSALASPAFAQAEANPENEQSDSGLQEIIVTAEKRAVNIQDVPIAVTAVSGDELRDRHVTDAAGLIGLVPNLGFNTAVGETRIAIRGITFENISATGAEARVAYHLDGVYLSRSGNINGTFFDVDRIEVLRGPQGTLFGRNAIAGAVNLISRDPTDNFEGYLQADVGNYSSVVVEGAVSGPIAEGVSFRIAGRSSDHSGYGKNLVTGNDVDNQHQRDFRAKLKIEPSANFSTILSADYTQSRGNTTYFYAGGAYASSFAPLGLPIPAANNLRDITSNVDPKNRSTFYGFGANSTLKLSDELSLVSVTSYRHGEEFLLHDNDYTGASLVDQAEFGSKSRQFSEELRLQGDYDWGNFLLGGYYFNEKYVSGSIVPVNPVLFGGPDILLDALRYGGTLKTKSYAAFAQATFNVSDNLHVTVGARYTKDQKRREGAFFQFDFGAIGPFVADNCRAPCGVSNGVLAANIQPLGKKSWGNFSPKVTIQYDLSDDANIYATFSKGFKSGAFQPGLDTFGNGVNPEKLTNYEAGFKGELLDRRLRVNLAGFYYDYKNLQVFQVLNGAVGAVLQNAAAAKLYGAEAEITAIPTDGLQINLSGALMHSEFTDFLSLDPTRRTGGTGCDPLTLICSLAGNRLPSAPTYTFNAGIQYKIPSSVGDFTARIESQSQSKLYFDQYQNDRVASKAFTTVNAFLNWDSASGKVYGSLYVRNLGDVFRFAGASVGNDFFGAPVQSTFIQPRTFGAKIGVRF